MSRSKRFVKTGHKRTDREKLELFISKFNELQNTKLAREGFKVEQTITSSQEKGLEFSLEQPDEADLKEFLLTFRHFISEREDAFLGRIFSICHQRLISNEIKQSLAQARQSFEEVKKHNGVHFQINGKRYSPLEVTDMYLNGRYFHSDLEYQQQLESMPPLTSELLRFYFLNFIIQASKIIHYVRNGVAHAFQEGLFQFEDSALT